MIHDGIYKVIVDNTLDDLKAFKLFLYRNIYGKYKHYEKILPKLMNKLSLRNYRYFEIVSLDNLFFDL